MPHAPYLRGLIALLACAVSACMSMPSPPTVGLQRSLYPGLGDLSPDQIRDAFNTQVSLSPPISAGLAWLSEAPPAVGSASPPLSEYHRTGVLEQALLALRKAPLSSVAVLPTIPQVADAAPNPRMLEALRSASAQFQYDVALLLQTAVSADRGLNILAFGYLGLVTIPLIPGDDIGVASSAEICGIDVRTGVMLGCSRGRAASKSRFVFPLRADSRRDKLTEETLRTAVDSASEDLLQQLSARLAK